MNDMKVKVKVEKQLSDKFYACYMLDSLDGFSLSGYGKTASEAIEDMTVSYTETKKMFSDKGKDCPSLEFEYLYDLGAYFSLYQYLSIEGVARKSGIKASVMRQYVSGVRTPNADRLNLIKEAILDISKEIASSVNSVVT